MGVEKDLNPEFRVWSRSQKNWEAKVGLGIQSRKTKNPESESNAAVGKTETMESESKNWNPQLESGVWIEKN